MSGANLQQPDGAPAVIDYPSGDGEPMAETGIHVLLMLTLIATLRHHLRLRTDTYVIGNIFLYYRENDSAARRSPDVMVIKGVEGRHERDSFRIWEERATPNVVIELTSKATADEDQGPKRALYELLGVRDYFLFDPLGEYLPEPLMGYRLIGGHYEPLQADARGGLTCLELGLRLVPDGADLLLFDYRTGQRLLTPPAAYAQLEQLLQLSQADKDLIAELRRQAEQARVTIEQARQREELARQAAEQARGEAEQARQREDLAHQAAKQARGEVEQARGEAEEALRREKRLRKRARQAARRAAELEQELNRLRGGPPPAAPPEA